MKFSDWSENEGLRVDLKLALENPAIQKALQTLEEENAPDTALKVKLLPGCTMMESIALDAERRAGVHQMIRTLRKLPYLNSVEFSKVKKMVEEAQGDSWDHIKTISRSTQPKTQE